MNPMERIREVRALYDIRSVLGLGDRKSKIVCPLPEHIHHSNTPSFHIYQNRDGYQKWHCFGNCSKWGDVIDLKGYMSIPNYDPQDLEMVRGAIALLTNSHEIQIVRPEIVKDSLPPGLWREYLPPGPEVMAYAEKRGLNYDTVVKFRLGQYRSFMSIPIFEEHVLKMVKFRNTSGGDALLHGRGLAEIPVQLRCGRLHRPARPDPEGGNPGHAGRPVRLAGLRPIVRGSLVRGPVEAPAGLLAQERCWSATTTAIPRSARRCRPWPPSGRTSCRPSCTSHPSNTKIGTNGCWLNRISLSQPRKSG